MLRREGGFSIAKTEIIISLILTTGVVVSAAAVFAGGIVYLAGHSFVVHDYRVFHVGEAGAFDWDGILRGVAVLDGYSLIRLGLLLLIATPVIRVVFSVAAFALQRDALYVSVTLAVLAMLFYSLTGHSFRFWG